MIDPVTFGDRIRAQLARAEMTQAQLAGKLRVTKARVSELFARETPPRAATVLRLATALHCEPNDLDPRLANESVPPPGSRLAKAAEILGRKLKYRVGFMPMAGKHLITLHKPGDPPGSLPRALIGIQDGEVAWGCLSESKLQLKVFELLNHHA